MKKLPLLLACALAFFSCEPNEDLVQEQNSENHQQVPLNSSTVMAEYHVRDAEENIIMKYYFDSEGRFIQSHEVSLNFTWNFSYDATNKLIAINKVDLDGILLEGNELVYDDQDKILTLGDRTFKYDSIEEHYSEGSSYELIGPYMDGGTRTYDYSYNQFWYGDPSNPIAQYCFFEGSLRTDTLFGGGTVDTGTCSPLNFLTFTYDGNNNITQRNDSGVASNFQYDNTVNPLFNGTTNLVYVFGFLSQNFTDENYALPYIISENNRTQSFWGTTDSGAISNSYSYEFNANNLPVRATTIANHGATTSEYEYANYYYQGDVIPED